MHFPSLIHTEFGLSTPPVSYTHLDVYKRQRYDSASVELGLERNEPGQEIQIDEVKNFLNGRYVGSTQAVWRIYELPMHFQSHVIVRLDIHLLRRQNVYFREGQERQAIENARQTKLLAFYN